MFACSIFNLLRFRAAATKSSNGRSPRTSSRFKRGSLIVVRFVIGVASTRK